MISNYEIGLGIQDILEKLKNAIKKGKDIIEIQDCFGDMILYKIYYNLNDLLEDDSLKCHIFTKHDDSIRIDLKDYMVIAFDFNIASIFKNSKNVSDILYFKNLIFMFDLNTDDYISVNCNDKTFKCSNFSVPEKLMAENCVFSRVITFAFDWDKIELVGCIFLDDLYIYDLNSEFNSYHCNFKLVFLENHHFDRLELHLCNLQRLEFYPDQQDLNMECIAISNSEINDLVINSHGYSKREYNNYDIEVNSIKVRDSSIENILCSDIQAKSMSFKRIYGNNFLINRTIAHELIFKDFEFKNLKFTDVFVNERKVTQDDYKHMMCNNCVYYKALVERLKELFEMNDNPQSRGFAFENFLKDLFEINGLQPRGSFKIEGEQIDGSFILHKEIYLLEAKWTNKPVDKAALVNFNEKVSSKSRFTRGLFISYSGYSEEALKTFDSGRKVNTVLMTVKELESVLDREKDFKEFLWDKVRALGEEGNFNKQILD